MASAVSPFLNSFPVFSGCSSARAPFSSPSPSSSSLSGSRRDSASLMGKVCWFPAQLIIAPG